MNVNLEVVGLQEEEEEDSQERYLDLVDTRGCCG